MEKYSKFLDYFLSIMPARRRGWNSYKSNLPKWRQASLALTQNRYSKISYYTVYKEIEKRVPEAQRENCMDAVMPIVSVFFRESCRRGLMISSLKYKTLALQNADIAYVDTVQVPQFVKDKVNEIENTLKEKNSELTSARQMIKALQDSLQKKKENNAEISESLNCTICFEPFVDGQEMATSPGPCSSFYCIDCIMHLIEFTRRVTSSYLYSCPCCRANCSKYISIKFCQEMYLHDNEQIHNSDDDNEDSEDTKKEAPECTNCNVPMVVKLNRQGKKFYSCPNWKTTKCPAKSF